MAEGLQEWPTVVAENGGPEPRIGGGHAGAVAKGAGRKGLPLGGNRRGQGGSQGVGQMARMSQDLVVFTGAYLDQFTSQRRPERPRPAKLFG